MPKMMNNNMSGNRKKTDIKKSFGRLFKFLKSYMPLLIVSMVLLITNTSFIIVWPNQLSKISRIIAKAIPIFDKGVMIYPGEIFEMSSIWNIVILLICLYAFGALFSYIANVLIARVVFKVSKKLRSDIKAGLLRW